MAHQEAIQDRNQFPAMIAHTGTAGTAEIVRVVSDAAGNLGVNIITGEVVASIGTVDLVKSGTIKEVTTVNEITNIAGGTVETTMGDISGGTIDVLTTGSIVVTAGTVETTMGDLSGGTIDLLSTIAAGTQNTLGTVGVLNDGSVAVTALVDLPGGTVDEVSLVAAGTLGDVTITSLPSDGTVSITNDDLLSTNNSSTDTLDAAGTYLGIGDDLLGYSAVTTTVYADADSATDGMKFQFSTDNTNWDDSYDWTVDTSEMATRRFQFPVTARYYRVQYINGAGSQGVFRVQTILHRQNQLTSIHRLVDDVSNDRSAQIVKSAIIAQVGGGGPAAGDFVPVQSTTSGNLRMSVEEFETTAVLGTVNEIGNLVSGTLATLGTVGVLNDGTISDATVTALPDLPGGTVDLVTTVTTVSSVSNLVKGTVTSVEALPDLPGGTVDLVTAVTTVTDVTDVSNITTGTLAVVSSVTNLAGGTIGILADGTVGVKTLPDLPGGTVDVLTAGTITSVANLVGGTVQVDPLPATDVLTVGALGTAGAAAFGTLSAASGAGTTHVISGLSMVVHSGTVDCYLGFGTAITGGSALARGQFPEGGGIARNFTYPIKSGTNSEICYKLGGAGTVYFTADYWKE